MFSASDLYQKVKTGLHLISDAIGAVEGAVIKHEKDIGWKNNGKDKILLERIADGPPTTKFGAPRQNFQNLPPYY